MNTVGKTILALLGTSALVAGFNYYNKYQPVLSGASGYSAKNICSGHFISGFSAQTVIDEALSGASSLLSGISFEVDENQKTVETSIYGLFPRRAVFTDGLGCTLLTKDQSSHAHSVAQLPIDKPNAAIDWPLGSASTTQQPALQNILQRAFAEDDPGKPKNTKAVVVIHKGKLIAEHYADGLNSDTPLIGWSMTKSITGLLVGMLVKDGVLDIKQPAQVPLWQKQKNDERANITVSYTHLTLPTIYSV